MKADYGGSTTPKELRDLWQTPLPLFSALDAEFGFYLCTGNRFTPVEHNQSGVEPD